MVISPLSIDGHIISLALSIQSSTPFLPPLDNDDHDQHGHNIYSQVPILLNNLSFYFMALSIYLAINRESVQHPFHPSSLGRFNFGESRKRNVLKVIIIIVPAENDQRRDNTMKDGKQFVAPQWMDHGQQLNSSHTRPGHGSTYGERVRQPEMAGALLWRFCTNYTHAFSLAGSTSIEDWQTTPLLTHYNI